MNTSPHESLPVGRQGIEGCLRNYVAFKSISKITWHWLLPFIWINH